MTEQTSAPADKPATNGATKVSWQHSIEGRQKISDAQKAAHARTQRNTTPLSPEKKQRLYNLVKDGSTVRDAAQLMGIGYSTAQRYVRDAKSNSKKKASNAGNAQTTKPKKGFRLRPEQIKILTKLVPKMGPDLLATEIAARAKCHVSSVYTYRSRLVNGASPSNAAPQATDSGLSMIDYVEFKETYKSMWEEIWNKRAEPTNAEVRVTRLWRRLNGQW